MNTPPLCCASCFGDRGLEKDIIPTLSTGRGICTYCQAVDVALVAPSALADVFGQLVNIYEDDASGRPLVEWLREDWSMFTANMTGTRATELLADILSDAEAARKSVSPSERYRSDRLDRWEKLRAELMHENRYFPDTQLDLERLRELLDHLQAGTVPTTWYRARLQTGDAAIALTEMGAPPPKIASHGRANPAGIPYLYLGSTPETAVAEIRPHTGDTAYVAEFEAQPNLKLVDLREPRKLISPFVLEDEDEIGLLRSDIAFLERLGDELTRPVIPQGAPFDYVPSQYLCEFIKKCGYQGVLYRSSVSKGMNLALFDPTLAKAQVIQRYNVTSVIATIQPIQ